MILLYIPHVLKQPLYTHTHKLHPLPPHTHPSHPQGAVIAPSEEDSQTFSVNGANGEIYKLRAVDAKERQYWVSRLRREVEHCTNQSFGTPVKEVGREGGRGCIGEVEGGVCRGKWRLRVRGGVGGRGVFVEESREWRGVREGGTCTSHSF